MLCSRCSEVVRPVVAIDIDGTLGDYHGHLIRFASAYFGVPPMEEVGPFQGARPMRDWFMDAFDCDYRTWADIKLAYRQGAQKRSMPAYPFAWQLVHMIKGHAEVWLTTTRPYQRLDGVDPDTRAWLSRHQIPYDGLLYDEDKYERLADRIDTERIVAVLDDLIEQLMSAAKLFHYGVDATILRKNIYNTAMHWPNEAVDLADACGMIVSRCREWEATHA